MKKIWVVILLLFSLTVDVRAETWNAVNAKHQVDSLFGRLTVAERIGQLIDLKIQPAKADVDSIAQIIVQQRIGAITITGGDIQAVIEIVNRANKYLRVPLMVSLQGRQALENPLGEHVIFPKDYTLAQTQDTSLLREGLQSMYDFYHYLGIKGSQYSPLQITISEDNISHNSTLGTSDMYPIKYLDTQNKAGLMTNVDVYFAFRDDFAFSPRQLPAQSSGQWQNNIRDLKGCWPAISHGISTLTIKSLPDFPPGEALYFNKKVINPLLWKHLEYAGILAADYDAIKKKSYGRPTSELVRSLMKIGVDKIVSIDDISDISSAISDGLASRYLRQNEIKEKVKRLLTLKYRTGITKAVSADPVLADSYLHHPEMQNVSYRVYEKAATASDSNLVFMPRVDVRSDNLASLTLGFSEIKTFQETLEKFAPFVHYTLPDASFDPYDLKVLLSELSEFDHVVVGIHTSGLVAIDRSLIDFLTQLNSKTHISIAFLGKAIEQEDFKNFSNVIAMHEDNWITEQIAAQKIFDGLLNNDDRLTFAMPEMEGMDSRTLEKIDDIAAEAIRMEAIPGCEVLVARNGAVVMQKSYGYYTYDSLMPVQNRTIYDLASVTKVAATTQAIMKLSEAGKINLDSTLGAYLPELEGTNKAGLVIRDVLAHQSGLRAFYPFWKNTIDDENQTLNYYGEHLSETYTNTVAYGMFASENLKDSLWHWTVATELRKKKHEYEPYDYKYSDLGFYMLQVLAERTSGVPLDKFVDSVFYKPMGMSTLGFNPLCKFPLKRIAPTERDKTFRHVQVWGTVHDQIAAMKGGVSGHAGLFGNANDLAKIMQMQLQKGEYGGERYLSKKTVAEFNSRQNTESRRGLGWDKPDKNDGYDPASRYASYDSFGHTGFTGTIVWADPTFNLIFVFLSNRIYPDMNNSKLVRYNIRKRIHDLVYESMWSFEKKFN